MGNFNFSPAAFGRGFSLSLSASSGVTTVELFSWCVLLGFFRVFCSLVGMGDDFTYGFMVAVNFVGNRENFSPAPPAAAEVGLAGNLVGGDGLFLFCRPFTGFLLSIFVFINLFDLAGFEGQA